MLEAIKEYRSISLIGMSKNAGKTTVLNYLISNLYATYRLGLTSIGFDGEELDHIYQTKKPRIDVYPNMVFASTKDALLQSTCGYEVIEELPIQTAMGPIVIGRVTKKGILLLTGPSRKQDLITVNKEFFQHGCQKVFIDGAFGKMMQSDHLLAEACILSTGAAYSTNLETLVRDTLYVANLFDTSHVWQKQDSSNPLTIESAITSSFQQEFELSPQTTSIQLHGACTDSFVTLVMKKKTTHQPLTIVLENPTYFFVSERIMKIAQAKQIKIAFEFIPKLLAITINPLHPSGVLLDQFELKQAFLKATHIPIINVCE